MRIYFLRHAEAEDGPVDAERRLTAHGRRDARRLGRYFSDLGLRFDLVFTSPLVRARETAEVVLKRCPAVDGAALTVAGALLNDTTVAAFRRWLVRLPQVECVLLVGHEPSLGIHARQLAGIPGADSLPLAKGAVVRVDTEDRKTGTLKLLISPKQLP